MSNGVSKPFFAALLALFAREAGAGRERMIVLGLDSAGWHTEPNLVVPDGIRLAYLPPYSPELQPAEHLWPVLDEPLANQYFETLADLERAVAERCLVLDGDQLSLGTNFHWWPKPTKPQIGAAMPDRQLGPWTPVPRCRSHQIAPLRPDWTWSWNMHRRAAGTPMAAR